MCKIVRRLNGVSLTKKLSLKNSLKEELTHLPKNNIDGAKFPELDAKDQEAFRQRAIGALIDGVRKFVMDVRELDIDLIDRINRFGDAYSILVKTMNKDSLRQLQAVISAKKATLSPDEACDLPKRAVMFERE